MLKLEKNIDLNIYLLKKYIMYYELLLNIS